MAKDFEGFAGIVFVHIKVSVISTMFNDLSMFAPKFGQKYHVFQNCLREKNHHLVDHGSHQKLEFLTSKPHVWKRNAHFHLEERKPQTPKVLMWITTLRKENVDMMCYFSSFRIDLWNVVDLHDEL